MCQALGQVPISSSQPQGRKYCIPIWRKPRLGLCRNIREMGVSKASPHQGKMFFQPFSISIFRCSRLILIWGLWYLFGHFTNITAVFMVFVATERANGSEIWCRSCTKQKCYGVIGEGHEPREQRIDLNSTQETMWFCWDVATYQMRERQDCIWNPSNQHGSHLCCVGGE